MWLVHALMLNDTRGYLSAQAPNSCDPVAAAAAAVATAAAAHASLFVSISSGNEKAFELKPREASVVYEKQFKNFSISPTVTHPSQSG